MCQLLAGIGQAGLKESAKAVLASSHFLVGEWTEKPDVTQLPEVNSVHSGLLS